MRNSAFPCVFFRANFLDRWNTLVVHINFDGEKFNFPRGKTIFAGNSTFFLVAVEVKTLNTSAVLGWAVHIPELQLIEAVQGVAVKHARAPQVDVHVARHVCRYLHAAIAIRHVPCRIAGKVHLHITAHPISYPTR